MLSDKKIKKELNKELRPTISVEQFCLDAGITFEVQQPTKPIICKRLLAKVFLPIASVAAVGVCVALPIALGRNSDGGNKVANEPKYGENEVVYQLTDFDSIYAEENVIMYNQSYVFREGTVNVITPIDSDVILGYRVSDVIYAEVIDGIPNFAFMFDYLIRCYSGYTIDRTEVYSNTDKSYTQNNIGFSYCIVDNINGSDAYVTFKYGKYDYFVHVRSYGNITEITEDNIQLFLQKAFTEEKQNDEAVGGRKIDS